MVRPLLLLAGPAFLLSGAAALVYQVAWQRILALGSGASIHSMAVIVAAFLAGLGLGSELGGRASRRLSPPRALMAFALVELLVAVFGALSPWLFHDLLYKSAPGLYDRAPTAALTHLLCLLGPTTLMGSSLPLLARGLVRDARTAGRTLGLLYGVNVVGASLGALLAPWVLIRFFGIRGAVLTAAGVNLAAAVLALVAGRWAGARAEGPGPADAAPATVATAGASLRLWAALYALSGFCALSLEIVYFRLVEIAVKSTAFTFGTVLSLYLLGSAVGSFAGAPLAPRLARPLRAFLLAQCALIALSAAAVALIVWLPPDAPGLSWYVRYWGGELPAVSLGSSEDPSGLARLYLALPLFLFGLPTFLMGLSFPILQRAVHHEADEAGRRVGLLQAANIAGCVAGSLLVGLVTLSVAGTIGTLRLLLALGLGFAGLGLAREGLRSAFTPAALVLAGLLAALPDGRSLWLRMHGVTGALEQAVVAEDATGVGAIFPTGGRLAVMIGGLYHSWLPFGGVHTRLGAAPAVLHPAPRDVAIIGLASGDTPWAAGVRKETRSITVFEIFRPQPRLLAAAAAFPWTERPALDPLRAFLNDPRVAFVIGDGRKALEREVLRYDVIEADALWPETAMSGNLYSVEFYELVARRLKPGGLMCSWTPTPRIRRTFRQVFPYVIALEGGGISVGSREPLALDPAAWRARLETPAAVAYLGREAVADVAERLERAQLRTDPPRREVNRDLYPKDEFLAPDRGRGESR